MSTPAWASRRSRVAPGHGRVVTWVMSLCLILWAVWAVTILAQPMHAENVSTLMRAVDRHDDVQWLAVEHDDAGPAAHFAPGLVDPLAQEWSEASITIPTDDGSGVTSGSTGEKQIAWADSRGLHVTRDFSTDGWRVRKDGSLDPSSSPSAAAYQALRALPGHRDASSVRALTSFGAIRYAKGQGSFETYGVVTMLSLLAALGSLWSRTPRFRTRWSWFWIFGCPMGVGLVWYLLREGWFGRERAPERRATGAAGFGAFVAVSLVLGSIVHAWLLR